MALSRVGTFGLVWLVVAAVAALVVRRGEVLLVTAAAVVVADTAAAVLKEVFDRPRPFVPFPEPDPLLSAGGDAFPSGHASTSFAAATVLSRVAPRLVPALVAFAAAIAWSRVYVGVHYPADVVAGGLVGVAVGASLAFVAGAAARGRTPPTAPRRPGEARRRWRRSLPRD